MSPKEHVRVVLIAAVMAYVGVWFLWLFSIDLVFAQHRIAVASVVIWWLLARSIRRNSLRWALLLGACSPLWGVLLLQLFFHPLAAMSLIFYPLMAVIGIATGALVWLGVEHGATDDLASRVVGD